MKYEYLLFKRNRNKDGLVYNKIFFNNSADARKEFRKDDVLFKCKANSVFYIDNWNGWVVKDNDIVKKYEK